MIPRAYIEAWRAEAPWVQATHVEQDLVISRALVEIFARPELSSSLAFRGGTALHKLHLRPAGRYSEDIDLVQITAGRARDLPGSVPPTGRTRCPSEPTHHPIRSRRGDAVRRPR